MILLNKPPATNPAMLAAHYRRCAREGVVFRSTMHREYFGLSDAFNPEWSVAAICWCAGGVETYDFGAKGKISLKAGAILAIGEEERYTFRADAIRPFVSSMIVFPIAMTRSLRQTDVLDADESGEDSPVFNTLLFRPSRELITRLNDIAAACSSGATDSEWYEEQAALIAAQLVAAQHHTKRRPDRINAAKPSTRKELVRRLNLAVELIHQRYDDPSINLSVLAREACVARHHFVRQFSVAYRVTPLRYLSAVRMDAAARLLESLDAPISEIARMVGFTNRSAFQRRFRSHFGTTPIGWQRRSRWADLDSN